MGRGVPWAGAALDLFRALYGLLQLGQTPRYTQLRAGLWVLGSAVRALGGAELSSWDSSL